MSDEQEAAMRVTQAEIPEDSEKGRLLLVLAKMGPRAAGYCVSILMT
jgi:hypothetical protein